MTSEVFFETADTIVAIATPPGRGGLGVVRLAGPEATRVACALINRTAPLEPRHATFARVRDQRGPADGEDDGDGHRGGHGDGHGGGRRDGEGHVVDQVVVTWFAAPHSYTGDDVVEISGHGSPLLMQRLVELAIAEGARLAGPGEFTLRAYLNGRMDLVQAEAVADLVNAVTPLQARAAMDQLEGTLTEAISHVEASLFDLAARLEASLDFPDEGFHFVTREAAAVELDAAARRLAALARDGRSGRVIREGRLVVLAGAPNAGKSSVFNALAGAARAIVTATPGTTRDVLSEAVDIGGLAVTLIDAAGWRTATDEVEAEGVARARQAQRVAALTLVVLDRSAPLSPEAIEVLRAVHGSRIIVVNKVDLPAAWQVADADVDGSAAVEISARSGAGLDELRARIVTALTGRDEWRDPPAITNVRHLELVRGAVEALERARTALAEGAAEELVLAELTSARQTLEQVSGRRTPEDLLRHIFATFCIGK